MTMENDKIMVIDKLLIVNEQLPQTDRLRKLNQIAIEQMKILTTETKSLLK